MDDFWFLKGLGLALLIGAAAWLKIEPNPFGKLTEFRDFWRGK